MKDAEDSWVRNLRIVDTTGAISAGQGTRRITINRVDITQSVPIEGHAKPADFSIGGTTDLSTAALPPATTSSMLLLDHANKAQMSSSIAFSMAMVTFSLTSAGPLACSSIVARFPKAALTL